MVVVRSSAPYALMYPWSAFLNCYCYWKLYHTVRESKGEPKEVPKSYLESYQEKCVRGGREQGRGGGEAVV